MGDAVTQRWSGILRTLASLRGGTVEPEQHLTTTSGGQGASVRLHPHPPVRAGGVGGRGRGVGAGQILSKLGNCLNQTVT